MIDALLLNGAIRALTSAQRKLALGAESDAREDAERAFTLIGGALGLDPMLVAGTVESVGLGPAALLLEQLNRDALPMLSSERDVRPSDDGELRA